MSRTRYFALCSLVLAGAFAGGFAANRAIPVAHAQTLPTAELRGTGGMCPSAGLTIRDANGRITWRSPRGSGIVPATAE